MSGMRSVSINGSLLTQAPDKEFNWYGMCKPLSHSPNGNRMIITATDSVNLQSKDTVLYYIKTICPGYSRRRDPAHVLLGSSYTDSLLCQDPDGDSLFVEKKSGPDLLTVQKLDPFSWSMTWTPTDADTVKPTIVALSIGDGYQTVPYSCTLIVRKPGAALPPPVKFTISELAFPTYLEVNKDSLDVVLATTTYPANEPLHFSAVLHDNKALTVTDHRLLWKPAMSDTGVQQLVVTVTDAFNRRDTLFPRIAVVPPNRPCSLSVAYSVSSIGNTLYLTNATKPETLFFSVRDPDPAIAESHTVRIVMGKTETVSSVDSTLKFLVILDPNRFLPAPAIPFLCLLPTGLAMPIHSSMW